MNIFDFAMQMELDGKAFYEKMARDTADAELKKVLIMLAEEENKHYHIFKKLREGEVPGTEGVGSAHSETLSAVKNIFRELSTNGEHGDFTKDEKSIWSEALLIEEKSENFYREKAQTEPDVQKRSILTMIANEERNHIYLIDSVLTYMKFPDTFSDTAQFKNFQSLEGH
ncbi:MAG: ferritin family protein [Candidatus Zixiibacteriota bacterium]|nr:MAG: ferritin family protein [candidate division Zixibacteria bacterium]